MRAISILTAFLALTFLSALATPLAAQSLVPQAAAPVAEDGDAAIETLVEALEDPDTRARLIEALRQAAPGAVPEEEDPVVEQTLAARVAEASVEAINGFTERIVQVVRDVGRLGLVAGVIDAERRDVIRAEGLDLVLTILVTVLIHRALRILSRRVGKTAARGETRFSQLALAFTAQLALRIGSVVIAWVAGYSLAVFVLSDGGIAIPQALYLNAFLAFGAFSVLLSTLVSRHDTDLTFSKLPAEAETVIYRNLRNVFGVLFYGLIAAVPITQAWSNFVIARSLRTVVITLVAILAVIAIRRMASVLRREPGPVVPEAAQETSDGSLTDSLAAGSFGLWDRVWPGLAYAYVAVAYVMALANPNRITEIVGRATLLSALALVAALVGLRLLSAAARPLAMPVPPMLGRALPTLSARLSGFLAPLCVVGAILLFVSAFLLIVEGWRLLEVGAWLSNGGSDVLWRIVSVAMILFALAVSWALLTAWIDRKLAIDDPGKAVSSRSRTLLALFRNAVTIALVVFGGMTALSELGIDIAPLLAGAGVIGLAVGFGAQKLVQDIITGVFIQLENAINEGDVVTVAGITGAVERLTIRSVGIRDLSGVYHLIPFSAVDTVGNYMRLFAYHVEVVGVAYDSDLAVAEQAMHAAFDALMDGPLGAEILAPLEYHGVIGLGENAVNLRARIKTKPGQQWAVGRAYTRELKRALDAAGIEIPFPHRELKLPKAMLDRLAGPPPANPAEG
ncbi:MAG: mechanosensitive ion channel domain-containing protein [Roseicyclus sp.]